MLSVVVRSEGLQGTLREFTPGMRKFMYTRLKRKSSELKQYARRLAPHSTGKLAKSIYTRVYKDPVSFRLGIPKTLVGNDGFPYPAFTAGQITITTKSSANQYFAPGQSIRYGTVAYTPSGNQVNWSASPMWWEAVSGRVKRSVPQTINRAASDYIKKVNSR